MIVLFSDFGRAGPYVGQMHARLHVELPGMPLVDLAHDAPRFRPRDSGVLLRAWLTHTAGWVGCVAVVDPGVGCARRPLALTDGVRWIVGPDNGLFEALYLTGDWSAHEILWRPVSMSASFHGRDLFAPFLARLISGSYLPSELASITLDAADVDSPRFIYADGFGNLISNVMRDDAVYAWAVCIGDQRFERARTFSDRPVGGAFWYWNSHDLLELAVNQGSAVDVVEISAGTPFTLG